MRGAVILNRPVAAIISSILSGCLGFALLVASSQARADAPEDVFSGGDDDCRVLVDIPTSYNMSVLHQAVEQLQMPDSFVVGRIIYTRHNIFDPSNDDENGFLYRLANDWHFLTKENVLEEQLLFKRGSSTNMARLAETERILRANHYLFDAEVVPRRICGNVVDIEIITRDVWTLAPEVRLKTSGGESSVSFVLRDSSFLGTGKQVLIAKNQDSDRSGLELGYFDNAFWGTRHTLNLEYQDNDDGQRTFYQFERPFFSFKSRLSYGATVERDNRAEPLFDNGEEFTEFLRDKKFNQVFAGWGTAIENDHVKRFIFGFTQEKHLFEETTATDPVFGIPKDREFAYPWFEFQYIEDKFVNIANIEQLHRREDINLGDEIRIRLGWNSKGLGADREGPIFEMAGQRYLITEEEQFLNYSYQTHLFYNRNTQQFENSLLYTEIEYNLLQNSRWRFNTSLSLDISEKRYLDQPLNLGGTTGMRGYPRAYTNGAYKVKLSIEERYFSDIHLWNLIRVGGAAFLDVGKVFDGDNERPLANIGLGVRLSSSRAELGKVLHIDYAIPLTDREFVDSYQWFVTIKRSF